MDTLISGIDAAINEQVIERNGTRVLVLSPNDATSVEAFLPQLQTRVARARSIYGGVLLRGFNALGASGFGAGALIPGSGANSCIVTLWYMIVLPQIPQWSALVSALSISLALS